LNLKIEKLKNKFTSFLHFIPTNGNNDSKQLCSIALNIEPYNFPLLIDKLQEMKNKYFYWNLPCNNEEFLSFSPLLEIKENISSGIEFTNSNLEDFQNHFCSNWDELNLSNVPLVVGGIKFSKDKKNSVWQDFSDSDWFIPTFTFIKNDGNYYLIYYFFNSTKSSNKLLNIFESELSKIIELDSFNNIDPFEKSRINIQSSPSIGNWNEMLALGLNKIQKGELQKVVLSKEVKVSLTTKPIISNLVSELSKKYPRCYCFAYGKNDSVFFGASPEKFVKFNDNNIEIDALAGSVRRGSDNVEDLQLERFLLGSKKNINEQKAVVTFIKKILINISEEITFDEQPIIRKLPNIQHLWTPINARLKKGSTLFDVLKVLNPTPAICGTPWNVAHKTILELESHDRGLYSGNVGWFNFNGYGEFAVAIRSALIKEKTLFAYSGCGIVEGSEPQQEFEESEIKLKPILSLFVDEKIYQS